MTYNYIMLVDFFFFQNVELFYLEEKN